MWDVIKQVHTDIYLELSADSIYGHVDCREGYRRAIMSYYNNERRGAAGRVHQQRKCIYTFAEGWQH